METCSDDAPNRRDLPLNMVNFAVVRHISGGPFVDIWDQIESFHWQYPTEIKSIQGDNQLEANILKSSDTKRSFRRQTMITGQLMDRLLEEVPSLSQPCEGVKLDELQITRNNQEDKFVAFILRDRRLLQERTNVISAIRRITGARIYAPSVKIEMNGAFLPDNPTDKHIQFVHRRIGTLLPKYALLAIPTLLPTP